jgi:opacity protein-like surface antigen
LIFYRGNTGEPNMKRKLGWGLWLSVFAAIGAGAAESPAVTLEPPALEVPADHFFHTGRFEATLASGVLFSPALTDASRATVNFTLSEIQLGYMLSEPKGWGWFRGNFEVAAEGFGGAIWDGPGSYVAGGNFWLRYNFLHAKWPVVPFVQLGGGMMATDTDRKLIGQDFNFNIDVGAGFRYFFARNWSVNIEYRYQHISNAKLAENDVGINAHGPMIGISRFF